MSTIVLTSAATTLATLLVTGIIARVAAAARRRRQLRELRRAGFDLGSGIGMLVALRPQQREPGEEELH